MFITVATDMALKRQQYQQGLMHKLIDEMLYKLLFSITTHDDRERIVNREGKVISRWRNA